MDDADMAQADIELALKGQLSAVSRLDSVAATGACLNCGEALAEGQRWCDSDCRDDWSRSGQTKVSG